MCVVGFHRGTTRPYYLSRDDGLLTINSLLLLVVWTSLERTMMTIHSLMLSCFILLFLFLMASAGETYCCALFDLFCPPSHIYSGQLECEKIKNDRWWWYWCKGINKFANSSLLYYDSLVLLTLRNGLLYTCWLILGTWDCTLHVGSCCVFAISVSMTQYWYLYRTVAE